VTSNSTILGVQLSVTFNNCVC